MQYSNLKSAFIVFFFFCFREFKNLGLDLRNKDSKQGDLLLVSWTNGGEFEKDRRRLFEELISTRE